MSATLQLVQGTEARNWCEGELIGVVALVILTQAEVALVVIGLIMQAQVAVHLADAVFMGRYDGCKVRCAVVHHSLGTDI